MGSPHTTDICGNCRNPIIQWNNTGAWEHLGSATPDQAKSRAYITGAKSMNLVNATLCNDPKRLVEVSNTPSKTNANYRTAKKV